MPTKLSKVSKGGKKSRLKESLQLVFFTNQIKDGKGLLKTIVHADAGCISIARIKSYSTFLCEESN